ncbi:MAG: hypothetical protein ACI9OO_001169, partial [Bacteroidia bacterium]
MTTTANLQNRRWLKIIQTKIKLIRRTGNKVKLSTNTSTPQLIIMTVMSRAT